MLLLINRMQDLYPVKSQLDETYSNCNGLNFYSPAYIFHCYERFLLIDKANRLFFLIIKKDHRMVSYLPLCIDKNKILRFLFDSHTDYCSAVGARLDQEVVKQLCKIITDDKNIHGLELDNLLPKDPLLNYLRHYLGNGSAISSYNNHSFLEASGGDGLLRHLKSKERSELKRVVNKNQSFTFKVLNKNLDFPLEQLKVLREKMISNKSRDPDFFNDHFVDLTRKLYEAGELEIFAKLDGEQFVSASIVLDKKDLYRMVWIDLFDSIQFINLSAYIEYILHLEENKKTFFSLGRGSYDYKSKNFQPQIENLYNFRYHKSKYNLMFSNYYPFRQFLKRLIRE